VVNVGFTDGPMIVLVLLSVAAAMAYSGPVKDFAETWGNSTEERNASYVENAQRYEQDIAEGNWLQAIADWFAMQVQAGTFSYW